MGKVFKWSQYNESAIIALENLSILGWIAGVKYAFNVNDNANMISAQIRRVRLTVVSLLYCRTYLA